MLTVCDYSDEHSKGGPCIRRKCEGYPSYAWVCKGVPFEFILRFNKI